MESNRTEYNFTNMDIYGFWTVSVMCLGFFLGPPAPCQHIFGVLFMLDITKGGRLEEPAC